MRDAGIRHVLHAVRFRRAVGSGLPDAKKAVLPVRLIPEDTEFVALGRLPGDTAGRVLERPVRMRRTTEVRVVQPLGRVVRVLVVPEVGDREARTLMAVPDQVPQLVLL